MAVGALGAVGDYQAVKFGNNNSTPSSANWEETAKRIEDQYPGLPDRTTTVEQKEKALEMKKRLISARGCPYDVKSKLAEEIKTLEKEIKAINAGTANSASIFAK